MAESKSLAHRVILTPWDKAPVEYNETLGLLNRALHRLDVLDFTVGEVTVRAGLPPQLKEDGNPLSGEEITCVTKYLGTVVQDIKNYTGQLEGAMRARAKLVEEIDSARKASLLVVGSKRLSFEAAETSRAAYDAQARSLEEKLTAKRWFEQVCQIMIASKRSVYYQAGSLELVYRGAIPSGGLSNEFVALLLKWEAFLPQHEPQWTKTVERVIHHAPVEAWNEHAGVVAPYKGPKKPRYGSPDAFWARLWGVWQSVMKKSERKAAPALTVPTAAGPQEVVAVVKTSARPAWGKAAPSVPESVAKKPAPPKAGPAKPSPPPAPGVKIQVVGGAQPEGWTLVKSKRGGTPPPVPSLPQRGSWSAKKWTSVTLQNFDEFLKSPYWKAMVKNEIGQEGEDFFVSLARARLANGIPFDSSSEVRGVVDLLIKPPTFAEGEGDDDGVELKESDTDVADRSRWLARDPTQIEPSVCTLAEAIQLACAHSMTLEEFDQACKGSGDLQWDPAIALEAKWRGEESATRTRPEILCDFWEALSVMPDFKTWLSARSPSDQTVVLDELAENLHDERINLSVRLPVDSAHRHFLPPRAQSAPPAAPAGEPSSPPAKRRKRKSKKTPPPPPADPEVQAPQEPAAPAPGGNVPSVAPGPLGVNKAKGVPLAKKYGLKQAEFDACRAALGLQPQVPPRQTGVDGKVERNPNFIPTPHWIVEGFALYGGADFLAEVRAGRVVAANYGDFKRTKQIAARPAKKVKGPSGEERELYGRLMAEWTAYRLAHKGVPVVSNPNTPEQTAMLELVKSLRSRIPRGMQNFLPKLGRAPPKKKERKPGKGRGRGPYKGREKKAESAPPALGAPAAPAAPAPAPAAPGGLGDLLAVLNPVIDLLGRLAAVLRPVA